MPYGTSLDGAEPFRLRGLAWLTLSDTATMLRGSATSDSGGGVTMTWGTVTAWGTATAVPCRVDPIGGVGMREEPFGGQIDERSTHQLTLPSGTDIDNADRVVLASGGTFEVTAVRQRTREWSRVAELVGT